MQGEQGALGVQQAPGQLSIAAFSCGTDVHLPPVGSSMKQPREQREQLGAIVTGKVPWMKPQCGNCACSCLMPTSGQGCREAARVKPDVATHGSALTTKGIYELRTTAHEEPSGC